MTPLVLLTLAATVDAPITQVTVFTNQARVVRTASVPVSANTTLEFPALRDTADVSTIRVESTGAEVKRVDIERVTPEKLRTEPAKKLLAEIDKVDTELERLALEHAALQQQFDALHRLSPAVPSGDPLKAAPKLNASGWQAAAQFAPEQLTKVQARLRETERAQKKANEARAKLMEEAGKLGNPQTTSGWKVTAQVSGSGPAVFTLTYLVRSASWTPTWDLQLQPDTNTVALSLAGLVSQSTGEDWTQATLLLSTAIPSHAVKVPKLMTWKIGVADRFIPTPTPMYAAIAAPPPVPAFGRARTEEELVRARLLRLTSTTSQTAPQGQAPQPGFRGKKKVQTFEFSGEDIEGELTRPDGDFVEERKAARPAPAAPPPPPLLRAPASVSESIVVTDEEESSFDQPAAAPASGYAYAVRRASATPAPVATFSLSPPPAWRPPVFGPDSPVTLAAGYDLSFASLQKETIPSAGGTRRVALWSAQWPVAVERKLFPALTTDAFLVAELKNPSQQVLPGGPAQLYVGADPAGTARLKLVSPGEPFTLPLGIDRALKPVRNVQLVEAEKGVFSKDEVGTYVVTIELANPYKAPVTVRVLDQFPLTDQKDLETKLLETKPAPTTQDLKKGSLEWRTTIGPNQKQTFSFTYTLKRPKGWKLQQQEVVR